MHKYLIFAVIGAFLLLLAGCGAPLQSQRSKEETGTAAPDSVHILTANEVTSYLASVDGRFGGSHIGYKGIYLSMTPKDLDETVHHSVLEYAWGKTSGGAGPVKTGKAHANGMDYADLLKVYTCYLYCDSLTLDQKFWNRIGCKENMSSPCYWTENKILVIFKKSTIAGIELRSNGYAANEIEAMLREWADFAIAAFIQKYGQPTTVYHSPKDLSASDSQSGYITYLCKWVIRNEELRIGFLELDSKYYCTMEYVIPDAEKKGTEESKKLYVGF